MEGNTLMDIVNDASLVHDVVLQLFRRGQSLGNICFLLNEELEKLSDADDYLKAAYEKSLSEVPTQIALSLLLTTAIWALCFFLHRKKDL
jgi:hypothetical protein